MTITSISKLPSGKTGATITSNLDELAILRGLVVNALRHMPDVCETVSTRQRLKAMSRVLHKVYTQEKPRVWFATTWVNSAATLDAEQEGKLKAAIAAVSKLNNPPAVFAEYTGKHRSVEKATATGCAAILNGMPDRFTYQEFADRVTAAGLATDHEAREILASLLNESKEWIADPIERVVKRVGVVHRRPLQLILDSMPDPFTRTRFIDEALDHGWTMDQASDWLLSTIANSGKYCTERKTDTVHRISFRPKTLIPNDGGTPALPGAVDPKSIPNPDYVSPSASTHPNNSTEDLKQASVPEEDRGQDVPAEVPVAATKRTTLFEVYEKMDEKFTFETFTTRAAKHGHDRLKVSAFVSLMCKIGSLRHMGGFLYEKLSSVTSSEMRHLASLIA